MFGSVSKLQISQAFLNMKFCRDFKIKVFAGHWRLKFGHEFVDHIETKRNKQCYYGWLYLSTDSSKLMPIRDWAALLKPSPRWVNAPAPLSLHHSSPQRSLLRSVLESLCSCSSCLFLSRVFNQIASTTNLLSLPYST